MWARYVLVARSTLLQLYSLSGQRTFWCPWSWYYFGRASAFSCDFGDALTRSKASVALFLIIMFVSSWCYVVLFPCAVNAGLNNNHAAPRYARNRFHENHGFVLGYSSDGEWIPANCMVFNCSVFCCNWPDSANKKDTGISPLNFFPPTQVLLTYTTLVQLATESMTTGMLFPWQLSIQPHLVA